MAYLWCLNSNFSSHSDTLPMKYKRILLKLSGEALMGEKNYGIDINRVAQYAQDIKNVHDEGVEIAIVIGGGNIYRGLSRSEEHTSELQSRENIVCRLLLENK